MAGRSQSDDSPASSGDLGMVVDPDALLAACDDDSVLLAKLIQLFQNNIPGALARVERAISLHDATHLKESAHDLRGLLATFSTSAAQAAALLESMGASGESGAAASTFLTLTMLTESLASRLESLEIDDLRRCSKRVQSANQGRAETSGPNQPSTSNRTP